MNTQYLLATHHFNEVPYSTEDHTGAWNANTVVGSWHSAVLDEAEVQTLEPPCC